MVGHPTLGALRIVIRSLSKGGNSRVAHRLRWGPQNRLQEVNIMVSQQRIIKGLGEIALRVNDLDKMQKFYEEVIGLELMRRLEKSAFFRIAEGVEGHVQVLALFDRRDREGYTGIDSTKSTVDHIAFGISKSDYESEKKRLEDLGYEVRTAYHDWVKWRSLYVTDPEGNNVEMVCYDEQGG